jgi:predicted RNA-binding protein YlxR (DUF448 family)
MRPRHVPLRTCAACGTRDPKERLVRIVRSAEGEIRVEPPRSFPGRGSYLCRKLGCWERGVDEGRLARALRGEVSPQTRNTLLAHAQAEYGDGKAFLKGASGIVAKAERRA